MNNEDMSEIFEKLNINNDANGISPEMVNNLLNMFNSSNSNSSTNAQNSSEDFNNHNNSNNDSDSNNDSNSNNTIDFETIMRMKTIIDKMNNTKDDPRSNLLYSLKPYLKESRQSKVDQYIQLMNMSKVIDVFPFLGGDKKNDK